MNGLVCQDGLQCHAKWTLCHKYYGLWCQVDSCHAKWTFVPNVDLDCHASRKRYGLVPNVDLNCHASRKRYGLVPNVDLNCHASRKEIWTCAKCGLWLPTSGRSTSIPVPTLEDDSSRIHRPMTTQEWICNLGKACVRQTQPNFSGHNDSCILGSMTRTTAASILVTASPSVQRPINPSLLQLLQLNWIEYIAHNARWARIRIVVVKPNDASCFRLRRTTAFSRQTSFN